jgi:hypothetical protein
MLTPSIVAIVLGGVFAALWLTTRVLCSGECNIRVDLLLLWPLLLGISLAVPIRYLVRHFRSPGEW